MRQSIDSTRQPQIDAALASACDKSPDWGHVALMFLEKFAREHGGLFIAEDIVAAAHEWGLSRPTTDRAWGRVFQVAKRKGIIRQVDNNGRRSNGSPTARYARG